MNKNIEELRVSTPVTNTDNAQPLRNNSNIKQIMPARSVTQMIQEELMEVDTFALQETLEEMSLSMGSKLKELKKRDKNDGIQWSQQALGELVRELDDPMVLQAMQEIVLLGENQDPKLYLQNRNIPIPVQLLIFSKLAADQRLSSKKREQIEKELVNLLKEEEWGLQLFAYLELGELSAQAFPQLRDIYRRAKQDKDPQQGLAKWFAEIKKWPDRKQRIHILLRALSFDLSIEANADQKIRLAATIGDLQKLLLFLSLEDHCCAVAEAVGLTTDQIIQEIIAIIEQNWIYAEWLASRISALPLPQKQQPNYLQKLIKLLQKLPESCFSDSDQKEQILKESQQLEKVFTVTN